MQEIINQVLKEIKPTIEDEKKVKALINSFLDKINLGLKDAKAILGGSGEKGTWLKDAHDADIFVQFDYNKFKDKSDKLSDILEKNLKKKFTKVERLHGSRDYFQIKQKEFTFEIVPILKISNAKDAINITDVSPLHAKWVKKHKQYADDIRLMKQFCKAQKVYGAESYIRGFSGYICEILVINYKGFLNTIKAGAKWKPKTIIDVEEHHKRKDILFELNKSKTVSPLIVIDPVQADRNAAAAISEDKYFCFINACKDFMKKQSKESFEEMEFSIEELNRMAGKDRLIVIEAEPVKGKKDVIGAKLLKVFEFIQKSMIKNDFIIKSYGWEWEKNGKEAIFWFIIDPKKISEFIEKKGPPKKMKKHAAKFKKEHKNTFVKGNMIYAKDKRIYREAERLIKDLIKGEYLKDKVINIKLV